MLGRVAGQARGNIVGHFAWPCCLTTDVLPSAHNPSLPMQGVADGTAPRAFKSAAEPEEPKEKGVAVIVGNTVESIVKDPTKDVLLEVYAPW